MGLALAGARGEGREPDEECGARGFCRYDLSIMVSQTIVETEATGHRGATAGDLGEHPGACIQSTAKFPAYFSIWTIAPCPEAVAMSIAVSRFLLRRPRLAPASSRALTISACPSWAAIMSAV